MKIHSTVLIAGLFVVGVVGAAACTGAVASDPTPVKTWKITPASGGSRTPTPDATATAPAAGTAAARDALTIVGVSNVFEVEEITAPAGTVTIVFDNQDAGVVHNIHFFAGDDAEGDSVGETELEPGPLEQQLEMDLGAGDYFYQCDAHPTTMTGTLTVV